MVIPTSIATIGGASLSIWWLFGLLLLFSNLPIISSLAPDSLAESGIHPEMVSLLEPEEWPPLSIETAAQMGGRQKGEEEEEGEGSGEEMMAIEALLDAAKVDEQIEEGRGREGSGGEAKKAEGMAKNGTEEEEGSRQKTDHCQPKLDFLFLLDSGGSLQQLYQEHVRWAVSLVESLPLEQDTVRVAAAQYAGFPLTEYAAGTYPSADDIRQRVQSQSGVGQTGYALRKAESELFRPDRGVRKGATKVIVLFTDGLSSNTLDGARQLGEFKHVKIFVVAIGAADSTRGAELNRIAGQQEENIFGPDDLARLREALLTEAERARACSRIGDDAFNNGGGGPRGLGSSGGLTEDREDPIVAALGEDGEEDGGNWTTTDGELGVEKAGRPMAEQIDEEAEEEDSIGDVAQMDEEEKGEERPDEEKREREEKEEEGGGLGGSGRGGEKNASSLARTSPEGKKQDGGEEEEMGDVDEWGLREGAQQAIDRRVAEGGQRNVGNEEEGEEMVKEGGMEEGEGPSIGTKMAIREEAATTTGSSMLFQKKSQSTSSIAPLLLIPSSTTSSAPYDPQSSSSPDELDVFEPVDGLPLPPTRAHPAAIPWPSPSPSPPPPTPRRTFPVRVELSRSFTRRPKASQQQSTAAAQPNGRRQPELKAFKEFPGANISKRLMKHGEVAMRIITAAIATSTRATTTSILNRRGGNRAERSKKTTTTAIVSTQRPGRESTGRNRPSTTQGATTTTTMATRRSTGRAAIHQRRAFGVQQVACPPVDILFLLDSSGSVHRVYENQKEWLEQILEQIQLDGGEDGGANGIGGGGGVGATGGGGHHRVALIQFAGADLQKTEWEWDRFRQSGPMMDAFHQVRHLTGTTYIGQAFQHAIRLLEERRRKVPTLVILLSDGFSQDDALALAQTMRKLPNLQFFALSIGQFSNTEYLHRLVDDPSHVFIGNQSGEHLRAQLLRRIHCAA